METANLKPGVYRRAACKLKKRLRYCCDAIMHATNFREYWNDGGAPHQAYFGALFKPESYGTGWWEDDDRESRLIALLLCADILESEQKSTRSRKRAARA